MKNINSASYWTIHEDNDTNRFSIECIGGGTRPCNNVKDLFCKDEGQAFTGWLCAENDTTLDKRDRHSFYLCITKKQSPTTFFKKNGNKLDLYDSLEKSTQSFGSLGSHTLHHSMPPMKLSDLSATGFARNGDKYGINLKNTDTSYLMYLKKESEFYNHSSDFKIYDNRVELGKCNGTRNHIYRLLSHDKSIKINNTTVTKIYYKLENSFINNNFYIKTVEVNRYLRTETYDDNIKYYRFERMDPDFMFEFELINETSKEDLDTLYDKLDSLNLL